MEFTKESTYPPITNPVIFSINNPYVLNVGQNKQKIAIQSGRLFAGDSHGMPAMQVNINEVSRLARKYAIDNNCHTALVKSQAMLDLQKQREALEAEYKLKEAQYTAELELRLREQEEEMEREKDEEFNLKTPLPAFKPIPVPAPISALGEPSEAPHDELEDILQEYESEVPFAEPKAPRSKPPAKVSK